MVAEELEQAVGLNGLLGSVSELQKYVLFTDKDFLLALLFIFLAPTIWNSLGRLEYSTGVISAAFGGPRRGCYALTVWIFSFSLYRDYVFMRALEKQPQWEPLGEPEVVFVAGIAGVLASIVLIGSFVKLGLTGTYLGDYFGILMDEKVTGFPFNVTDHPMYDASTVLFTVRSVFAKSPAGLLLSIWVYTMYSLASHFFEGPFTERIYAEKAQRDVLSSKKTS